MRRSCHTRTGQVDCSPRGEGARAIFQRGIPVAARLSGRRLPSFPRPNLGIAVNDQRGTAPILTTFVWSLRVSSAEVDRRRFVRSRATSSIPDCRERASIACGVGPTRPEEWWRPILPSSGLGDGGPRGAMSSASRTDAPAWKCTAHQGRQEMPVRSCVAPGRNNQRQWRIVARTSTGRARPGGWRHARRSVQQGPLRSRPTCLLTPPNSIDVLTMRIPRIATLALDLDISGASGTIARKHYCCGSRPDRSYFIVASCLKAGAGQS